MKFYIVDAFTKEAFGGNPAGVIILPEGEDFPNVETMIKVAKELRYSETAFIKQLDSHSFNIRYFTPAAEVDLCGHATIGSFKALLESGVVADNSTYTNHTAAGVLSIDIKHGEIFMDMAEPQLISTIDKKDRLDKLYEVMGLVYDDEKSKGLNLLPMLISTGLPDIMMPVSDLKSLDKIQPNMKALAELSKAYNVTGVHAFTRDCHDATCHVRNFAPLYDIDEEAATGTSNGALTYYGYLNNFIKSGDNSCFIQGEKMQRPSVISSFIFKDENSPLPHIKVGGDGVILAKGEFML